MQIIQYKDYSRMGKDEVFSLSTKDLYACSEAQNIDKPQVLKKPVNLFLKQGIQFSSPTLTKVPGGPKYRLEKSKGK